jgi:hypothetical protein
MRSQSTLASRQLFQESCCLYGEQSEHEKQANLIKGSFPQGREKSLGIIDFPVRKERKSGGWGGEA